ncbi:hypothetical protein GCM10010353_26340 [Streptomyces chryseus]|uniref:Uncharacterized protein n=1 Tax=Streptomyces chryseus TaxID=68186 RepID=A0ABQ3DRN5_9ACTN|nr:hypothetical protein GCM10010353_26340 [Streptomyces chryseus]GHB06157.1 hypothetical protein GCM10010346_31730 [Streptomyces chryseus]
MGPVVRIAAEWSGCTARLILPQLLCGKHSGAPPVPKWFLYVREPAKTPRRGVLRGPWGDLWDGRRPADLA